MAAAAAAAAASKFADPEDLQWFGVTVSGAGGTGNSEVE